MILRILLIFVALALVASAAQAQVTCPAPVGPGRVVGDISTGLSNSFSYYETGAQITAPRTWTLPVASSVNKYCIIVFSDQFGGITPANPITLAGGTAQNGRQDTISGNPTYLMNAQYAVIFLQSDGTSKWVVATGCSNLGGDVSGTCSNVVLRDSAQARANLGLGTMAVQNASAVAITGGTINNLSSFSAVSGGNSFVLTPSVTDYGAVVGTQVQSGTISGSLGDFGGAPEFLFTTSSSATKTGQTLISLEGDMNSTRTGTPTDSLYVGVIGSSIQRNNMTLNAGHQDEFAGGFFVGSAVANQGGSVSPGTASGSVLGISTIANLYDTATGFVNLRGIESDVFIANNASANYRIGIGAADFNSFHQATVEDMAYGIWSSPSAIGFACGLCITNVGGGSITPLASNATFVKSYWVGSITAGIDLTNLTMSGSAWASAGATITGVGAATFKSVTATPASGQSTIVSQAGDATSNAIFQVTVPTKGTWYFGADESGGGFPSFSISANANLSSPYLSLVNSTVLFGQPPKFASSTTGAGTQTFTNSPCSGLTTERWIPVQITGQSGTWNVPACQ